MELQYAPVQSTPVPMCFEDQPLFTRAGSFLDRVQLRILQGSDIASVKELRGEIDLSVHHRLSADGPELFERLEKKETKWASWPHSTSTASGSRASVARASKLCIPARSDTRARQ